MQKLTELKDEIGKSALRVGDFNIPFSTMDIRNGQIIMTDTRLKPHNKPVSVEYSA